MSLQLLLVWVSCNFISFFWIGYVILIFFIGCWWVGDICDFLGLWDFLKNKCDGWCEFNYFRFFVKGFYYFNKECLGFMRIFGVFFMDEDVCLFDYFFFGIIG